jgi:RND family efflux transporter MFP subunit
MAFKLNFGFLKSKKFIIFSVIALIIVISIVFLSGQGKTEKYDTVKVLRGDLVQTVDVTGNLQSSDNLELHFQVPGVVSSVRVIEGSQVKKGQLLANLSLAELDAAVAAAQASLDQKLAGATLEQINASQKQIDSAQTALDNANKSLNSVISQQNILVANSLNALLNSSIAAMPSDNNLSTLLPTISGSYSSTIEGEYGISIYRAGVGYRFKVSGLEDDNNIVSVLTPVAFGTRGLYIQFPTLPVNTSDTWTIYLPNNKANNYLTNLNNYNAAKEVQNSAISSAQSAVAAAEAALNLQKANYESLIAKPRDVDVAYYEAALDQAKANRNKAILIAPISGEISKVYKKVGELVSSIDPMIELISPHFEIDVDVPETDVVKLKVDDKATITFDALGTDIKFSGTVMSIEPSSTNIQDVVYYKVKVGISETEDDVLKSGMTTNITVNTADREGVLSVPLRSVLTRNDTGQKYVRTLVNNEIVEKDVITGLKADGGLVEIISGLLEGEVIVLKIL